MAADRTDILQVFMETKYKDGTPLSDDEITGLLIALLFAGQHTSSITSTWTGMFIAKDRDILKRVVQEQVSREPQRMRATYLTNQPTRRRRTSSKVTARSSPTRQSTRWSSCTTACARLSACTLLLCC